MLGVALVFVSRLGALIYLVVVSYLLYRIRAMAHAEAQGRASAQRRLARNLVFPVPQVIIDVRDACKSEQNIGKARKR